MRASAPLLLLALAACAYFNGVYNARVAESRADRLARSGEVAAAREQYLEAAREAEAVLTSHPRSGWAYEARYVAGRAWALAERCAEAIPHLEQWLAEAGAEDPRRERASLAYGQCLVRQRRLVDARELLDPLTGSGEQSLAAEASLWAARASLGLRDYDLARGYLGRTSESHAEWELALAYAEDGRPADAEPLLLSRAEQGDFREDVLSVLSAFWRAGRREAVHALVRAYDRTEAARTRARLHLHVGELLLAAGEDVSAYAHFLEARQLSRDGYEAEVASARLTLLSLRELPALLDVVNAVEQGLPVSGGSPEHRRLWSAALLTSMLARHVDHSGAALFLAGEVARDSLRAFALARTLFLQAADQYPRSTIAPKALLAVAAMYPDVPWHRARLLADYPGSAFAAITRGEVPAERHEMELADALLTTSWNVVARAHGDSVARVGASELAAEIRARSSGGRP